MPGFISLEHAVQLTSGCVKRLNPEKADGAQGNTNISIHKNYKRIKYFQWSRAK